MPAEPEPPAQPSETASVDWRGYLNAHHAGQVAELATTDKRSLTVDYQHLRLNAANLAQALTDSPRAELRSADEALSRIMGHHLEDSENGVQFHVRISNLTNGASRPGRIREIIRNGSYGRLVAFDGMVTSMTGIKPEVMTMTFRCERCGETMAIPQTDGVRIVRPALCENRSCASRGPFTEQAESENSEYRDWQSIGIQEKPESLRRETTPRVQQCVLRDDLCDTIRPGSKVVVTGIPYPIAAKEARKMTRIYDVLVDINQVEVLDALERLVVTKEDEAKIIEFSKRPDLYAQLASAIAPDLWGLDPIKLAIALQLFGGNTILHGIGAAQRGWINILLVGDPSTGKSRLLVWVADFMPGAMYGSGTGASKVGLTAAAIRDELTGEWVLQAGVFVLAHESVACLDEIDKMGDDDREGLTLAMDQGILAIDKAKIHATLVARSALLGAANPKYGRFDAYRALPEQIELTPAIISRFDLIFSMRDVPKPEVDEAIARHTLERRGKPVGEQPHGGPDAEFLKKYIQYARDNCHPVMRDAEAQSHAVEFYKGLRQESLTTGTVALTHRQFQSILRLAEARARARLSDTVTKGDVEVAINLLEQSLKNVGIDAATGKADIDGILTGKFRSQWDRLAGLIDILREQCRRHGGLVPVEEVYEKAAEAGIDRKDAERLVGELRRKGDIYEPKHGYLSWVGAEPRPARKAPDGDGEAGGDWRQDHWPAGG